MNEKFSNQNRLESFELFSLQRRRLGGNLIYALKIMIRLDMVEKEKLFLLVKGSRMKGHRFKVI